MRKWQRQSDGSFYLLSGHCHEELEIRLVPVPDSYWWQIVKSNRGQHVKTGYRRFRLYMIWRRKVQKEILNTHSNGDWSEGGAKFWGVVYGHRSWEAGNLERWGFIETADLLTITQPQHNNERE